MEPSGAGRPPGGALTARHLTCGPLSDLACHYSLRAPPEEERFPPRPTNSSANEKPLHSQLCSGQWAFNLQQPLPTPPFPL